MRPCEAELQIFRKTIQAGRIMFSRTIDHAIFNLDQRFTIAFNNQDMPHEKSLLFLFQRTSP